MGIGGATISKSKDYMVIAAQRGVDYYRGDMSPVSNAFDWQDHRLIDAKRGTPAPAVEDQWMSVR